MTSLPQDVLHFWFEDIDRKLWFNSTDDLDTQIREKFEHLFIKAINDELREWENSPSGCLALVILLDQFPLNMYRGKAESFSGEAKSREIARHAIDSKFDHQLGSDQNAFLFMPFMHSENMEDQELSVLLYEKAGLLQNLRYAKHHRGIVKQYGRFPHRNKILKRRSTDAELEYLKSDEAFLG